MHVRHIAYCCALERTVKGLYQDMMIMKRIVSHVRNARKQWILLAVRVASETNIMNSSGSNCRNSNRIRKPSRQCFLCQRNVCRLGRPYPYPDESGASLPITLRKTSTGRCWQDLSVNLFANTVCQPPLRLS